MRERTEIERFQPKCEENLFTVTMGFLNNRICCLSIYNLKDFFRATSTLIFSLTGHRPILHGFSIQILYIREQKLEPLS